MNDTVENPVLTFSSEGDEYGIFLKRGEPFCEDSLFYVRHASGLLSNAEDFVVSSFYLAQMPGSLGSIAVICGLYTRRDMRGKPYGDAFRSARKDLVRHYGFESFIGVANEDNRGGLSNHVKVYGENILRSKHGKRIGLVDL